jgi:predicted AAA+ superfamily ATPase
MAISNSERIGKALEIFNRALRPYVRREMEAVHNDRWLDMARQGMRDDRAAPGDFEQWDTTALIGVVLDHWNNVFRYNLGGAERSLVHEIRDVRNRWAHQQNFSSDDAYRALDSMGRFLAAVSAAEEATEMERQRMELMRLRFEEQSRRERRKASAAPMEGTPAAGYKPWREVVTPHPDVASGRYQQAEFAADLGQVHRGEGSDEYRNPRDFFQRTYITEGLRHLLANALRRLNGQGGDPVVELQTNFGGGKTHSMLALYHLFSGVGTGELAGLEGVIEAADGAKPVEANRAVLVGTALSPAQTYTKADGVVIHTLWGEMAYQLLGAKGYAFVAQADQKGVSPGSETLRQLFAAASPCLILIDEWVAYLRNMYKVEGLPSGSFESNLTFAQALTEAAKLAPDTLVVASIPASNIEIGGEGGHEALHRIQNTFARVESNWRPASTEESFEIVRRRLFQPITDPQLFAARDAAIKAFADFYRANAQEFPSACREGDYERRMRAAYPIHPELFDQLFNAWSTLDKFQRTRGVLRLMASVIHTLWEREDKSLVILPSSVPIDAAPVQFELTRYLEENWVPVIEKDVDGPQSLPLQQDRENPNLGRYSASRRVARTIFMGSAPTLHMANKGLPDQQIKLGCVQPGEAVGTFGDALRRLTDKATHLYVDGSRYWLSTQPSVTRLAQDRSAQFSQDEVWTEIQNRLREEAKHRGDFSKVHPMPGSSVDVPDERDARLVILGPEHPHNANNETSPARDSARDMLDSRGNSPRIYRNTLAFLAPDRTRLAELEQAARQFLAWKSIEAEREQLHLDSFQASQAKTQRTRAEEAVRARIPETYVWLLVPGQRDKTAGLEWSEIRLQGQEALAVRASKRLRNEDLLVTVYAGTLLRMELDKIPLWRGDHVSLKQLIEDFAQYLYLPRLKRPEVLVGAVEDGLRLFSWEQDSFAYAQGYDEASGRYRGLTAGQGGNAMLGAASVVVSPAAANKQFASGGGGGTGGGVTGGEGGGGGTGPGGGGIATETLPRRFHGTVVVDPLRAGKDAARVFEEVLQHLVALMSADVEVTIEIQARVPEGVPANVVRTVTENARTLKFTSAEFEEE